MELPQRPAWPAEAGDPPHAHGAPSGVVAESPPGTPSAPLPPAPTDSPQATADRPPWISILASTCLIMGETMVFLLLFSDIFYGAEVFNALSVNSANAYACVNGSFLLFVLIYVLDFSYWKGSTGVLLRRVFTFLCFAGAVVGALLYTNVYPELPLAMLFLVIPLSAFVMRDVLFRRMPVAMLLYTMSFNFCLSASVSIIIWAAWMVDGNQWSHENQEEWAEYLKCDERENREDDATSGGVCRAVVILWISPVALFGSLSVLSSTCLLLGRSIQQSLRLNTSAYTAESGDTGTKSPASPGSPEQKASHLAASIIARLLKGSVAMGLIGMYSSATLVGGELGMTKAFYAMCLAMLLAILILCVVSFSWQVVEASISQNKLVRKLVSMLQSQVGRGFLVFIGTPLFVVVLILSFLNQRVRLLRNAYGCSSVAIKQEDKKQLFTSLMTSQLRSMAAWPWFEILSWAASWAIIFGWVLSGYVITLAYLIFASLIYFLKYQASLHWMVVSVIFFFFGEFMFLNPAIPGPAVYLTAGVLLVPIMVDADEPTGDIIPPLMWACGLCYIMKLVAHVGQQKIFGETLGSKPSVRSLVSPNSTTMRAIRYVLEQRGLSIGKLLVLCGGPDWPTSVLCGLLKLNMWQMLLGLTPMIFFIAPSVAAGAFQYYGPNWGGVWDSLSAFLIQFVLVLAAALMGLALYFIDQASTHHADELAAYPLDEEV